MTNSTEKHREEAQAIIEEFFPPDANPEAQWKTRLIRSVASAFSARDAEVSKVLEGLRYSEVGWCWCKGPGHHISACLAARALFVKLQPTKE